MRRETIVVTLSVCITIIAAGAFIAHGGPLDPPQGPVESTYKTLHEVEPRTPVGTETTPGDAGTVYKIVREGSYYLTDDLVGEAGKHGIVIAATNVVLDLNGFRLYGFSLQGDTGTAVIAEAGTSGIVVRNGNVRLWNGDGIDLSLASESVVEDVVVTNCAWGIQIGAGSAARNCTAADNANPGFALQAGGGTFESCRSLRNFTGFDGTTDGGALFVDCVASDNSFGGGFNASNREADFRSCRAIDNQGTGFQFIAGAAIDCTAVGNAHGILVKDGGTVSRCTIRDNENGIWILGFGQCHVTSNLVTDNAKGILADADRSRIDDNHVAVNNIGIEVTGTDNTVTRNVASGNGVAYDIAGGNIVGTTRTDTTNAGPWDNFLN